MKTIEEYDVQEHPLMKVWLRVEDRSLHSDGIPYFIFTFCALLPWQLFAHALSELESDSIRL